jgi:hypothetical protein
MGAMLTATCLTPMLDSSKYQAVAAFSIGVAWTSVIEILRERISIFVEGALGAKRNENRDSNDKNYGRDA